jgi:hypothetical protein
MPASCLSSFIVFRSTIYVCSAYKNSCSGLHVETGSVATIVSGMKMFGKVYGSHVFNAAMAVSCNPYVFGGDDARRVIEISRGRTKIP